MTDQWLFKSETYDNCNCAINCGCQFNLPTTYGFCQSAYIGQIIEGHFNGISLVGLKWAGLYKWPGEIAEGNGMALIVVDERADAAQRTALETILSGRACAPLSNVFAVFASTCSKFCETRFLAIELEADLDNRTARAEIPGTPEEHRAATYQPLYGQDFRHRFGPQGREHRVHLCRLGLGTTEVAGEMEMAFEDTWALFVVHRFDQDGIIRDRPRLTAWLGA